MERLSGLDASFLYNETPTLHMHTLKYTVLDVSTVPGGYSFGRFVDELDQRLHLLPPFRRRIVEVPGRIHHPVWIEDPDFDLIYHVRRIGCPPPGGRREMDDVIAEIASWPLDRNRPLWEIWVLEGLDGGRIGFLAKVHHAVADGIAAAALLANIMTVAADDIAAPPPETPWQPERMPTRWRLSRDAVRDLARDVRGLPELVRDTVQRLKAVRRHRRTANVATPRPILDVPRTPFNGALTPHRSFAATSLPLDDVKAVKNAFGVTINDIVLTIAGEAVCQWLANRDVSLDKALVAAVPVGIDTGSAGDAPRLAGNRVSNMFVSLRTDVDDLATRLPAVHEAAGAAKDLYNVMGGELLAAWSEYTPPRPYAWAMRQYGKLRLADRHRPPINLVVSNVPGPREPLYVAGGRMEGIWSVGPLVMGVGLNITVWSYCDRLNVGVVACKEHIADPHELTDGMAAALARLTVAAMDAPPKATSDVLSGS